MRDRKANADELKSGVFDVISHRRAEVIASAAMGSDAAVIDCGEVLLHTDPITGRCSDIGSLAIKVASNDVAAAGGEPLAFLLTVLLPKEDTVDELRRIMRDAEKECEKIGAEIVGGHSEFTSAVTRPVLSAVAVAGRLNGYRARKPVPGDCIVMTKTAAMEATVLMAERAPFSLDGSERAEVAEINEALSVIEDCRVAAASQPVLMHDVTEGGIENAVYELLSGAGVGGIIFADRVPSRKQHFRHARAEHDGFPLFTHICVVDEAAVLRVNIDIIDFRVVREDALQLSVQEIAVHAQRIGMPDIRRE